MECAELLRKVRIVINEAVDDNDVSLLSVDTRSLDDSILELLPRAVLFVQSNKGVNAGCVNSRTVTPSALDITVDEDGVGELLLPDDFVSLVSLQLAGWQSPACRMYAHNSREALWQQNEYTRAGCCRPVCVEAFTSGGKRCARLFPLPDGEGAVPKHFIYEAAFRAEDGLNGYDNGMVDAVVYKCASLLYTMFERYDAANAMLSLALAACDAQNGRK